MNDQRHASRYCKLSVLAIRASNDDVSASYAAYHICNADAAPFLLQSNARACLRSNYSLNGRPSRALARSVRASGSKRNTSAQAHAGMAGQTELIPWEYQKELIERIKTNNILVTLPTGSGKTLIAAEVIKARLPAIKAADKTVVFLAPTNPLVAQQCHVGLVGRHGINAQAYHGDVSTQQLSTWSRERWCQEVRDVDVLVMTPDVLLHVMAHGVLQMSRIGLLVFDEAHHCSSDHPYAQIMEDFYRTTPLGQRPQVVGLTASPEGLEGAEMYGLKKKKNKKKGAGAGAALGDGLWGAEDGLQHRLDARLITVDDRLR